MAVLLVPLDGELMAALATPRRRQLEESATAGPNPSLVIVSKIRLSRYGDYHLLGLLMRLVARELVQPYLG
ncbi:MAG: hypothetical protein WAL34_25415 [Acidobacteriaceae bacterium]